MCEREVVAVAVERAMEMAVETVVSRAGVMEPVATDAMEAATTVAVVRERRW